MPPEAGIKVFLNTQRVRKIRKMVLELLLANHDRECTSCDKSGSCELQQYAEEYGVKDVKKYAQKTDWQDICWQLFIYEISSQIYWCLLLLLHHF
jgi:NADH dehydrogenase/NADH:ubiquinone oxidoreductase subunit G